MDVVRDGEKIGEADEVRADSTGQIVAVVIDFEDDSWMTARSFSRSTS